MNKKKHGQEEMIGFVLIVILVAVILLVFLGFSLRRPVAENVESYEVENFLQALLQHTSDCESNLEYSSVKKLIFDCYSEAVCLDGRTSCEVLNSSLKELIGESWKIKDRPVRGYEMKIDSNTKEMFYLTQGNLTGNYRGASQYFTRIGNDVEIFFKVYG